MLCSKVRVIRATTIITSNSYRWLRPRPDLIAMIQEQPFYGQVDEDPYTHLREFEQLCSCRSISGMTQETLKWQLFPFPFWKEQKSGILIR